MVAFKKTFIEPIIDALIIAALYFIYFTMKEVVPFFMVTFQMHFQIMDE